MGMMLLAVAVRPAHGAAVASSLPGGHHFWVGLAIGLLVGLVPVIPWWLKMVGLAIAVLAAGFVHVTRSGHVTPGGTVLLVAGLVGLLVGLYFGRVRGLTHLGAAELRNRRTAMRGISRF